MSQNEEAEGKAIGPFAGWRTSKLGEMQGPSWFKGFEVWIRDGLSLWNDVQSKRKRGVRVFEQGR